MNNFQKSQAAKILASYSNVDDIEKGGPGSGRKKSFETFQRLSRNYSDAKGVVENFENDPPKDYMGKVAHKDAENRLADEHRRLREHYEDHHKKYNEHLDSGDPAFNHKMRTKLKKSEEIDIEKGGVGSGRKKGDKITFTKNDKKYIGEIESQSRSGRYVVKTTTGYPVHKESQHHVHEDEIEKGGPGSGRKK